MTENDFKKPPLLGRQIPVWFIQGSTPVVPFLHFHESTYGYAWRLISRYHLLY